MTETLSAYDLMRGETLVPTNAAHLFPGDVVMRDGYRSSIETVRVGRDVVEITLANGMRLELAAGAVVRRVRLT